MKQNTSPIPNEASALLRKYILDNLTTGNWLAGYQLPTERNLSESFQVGRSVVRRVINELKDKGYLRQKVGSGTYVVDNIELMLANQTTSSPSINHISPAELMEARLVLEPALIELVINNASSIDFEYMDYCCQQGELASSFEQFEYWDGELHKSIAKSAHNNFVISVFDTMTLVRSTHEWGMLKRQSITDKRRLEYQQEHRLLVQALKNRDKELARTKTLEHLLHVRRNLLGH